MTWIEYGQETRHRIVRDLAASLDGKIIELGASRRNKILQNSITVDVKKDAHHVHDLNKGLPFKANTVDNIVACEIIEHMQSPFAFLKEIKKALKKGGYLILTTPNICCLKNRIKILLGKFPINAAMSDFYRYWVDEEDIPQIAHLSDYNIPHMITALQKVGFEIVDVKSNGVYFRGKLALPLSITPATWGENMIIKARML